MKSYWMSKVIAHRANLSGDDPNTENSPHQVDIAIELGFDVEIDLRFNYRDLFLGHDHEDYKVDFDWLNERKNNLYIHCKTSSSLNYMLEKTYGWRDAGDFNFFFHINDDVVLTSQRQAWVFPGKELVFNSVAVMPELFPDWDITKAKFICSDFPIKYKELYK